MDKVKIIILHSIFTEPAIVLATRLGVEIIKDFTPVSGFLYIVYGAHEKSIELIKLTKTDATHIRLCHHEFEPPLSQFMANKFYIELMKNNVVFDYQQHLRHYLKKTYGINVKSFHFFDFPEYQEEEEPERTIDIFLLEVKQHEERKSFINSRKRILIKILNSFLIGVYLLQQISLAN
jgi:hypothetical protein